MTTYPYSMLRGRVIRVTELDGCGLPTPECRWVVSSAVASVAIEEKTYSHAGGVTATDLTDEVRLVEPEWEETIGYTANLSMLQVDPDIISIVSGNPTFADPDDSVIGFSAEAMTGARTFALEVWTKLAGAQCAGKWGYTLFPRLWGGRLAGHTVSNGLANIDLVGAQCLRGARWTEEAMTYLGFGEIPFGLGPFGQGISEAPEGLVPSYNRFWMNALVNGHPVPSRSAAVV